MSDIGERLQASLIGSYAFERELGGGGMSRVFLARDTALARSVVVKVLAPELAAGVSAERFQREIRLAAALQHPNIVPVLAAGVAADLPYYTMPFVDGLSLRARLAGNDPLPIAEIASILKDLTRALAYAHERGVVHRDIKPENILLSGDAAVVTDFGIAKALQAARTEAPGDTLTQIGTSLGTPAYMAPEQAAGDPATDQRADIYALGCVAYEMITGSQLFAGRPLHQLFLAHATEPPPGVQEKRPDCPHGLAALVMRCLEKDPALRPQSAREVLQSLDAAMTPAASRRFATKSPAKLALWSAAAVAAAAAVITILFNTTRRSDAPIERSLAVLPFDNVGGDTADAYFAEGIAEELITALSKVSGVRVAGRASSFRFHDKSADMRAVARRLNVVSLLDGTVRRSGDRMRITAQLVNPALDSVLWSESYDREIRDAFAVQDEISRAITSALRVRLADSPGRAGAAHAPREISPEAYEPYLKGLALRRRGGRFSAQSIPYFELAIAKDSGFARAWAELAGALANVPLFSTTEFSDARAFAAARRAIALDSSSAEAHSALGTAYLNMSGDIMRALPELEHAVALDPNYSDGRQRLAIALSAAGEYDRSVAEAQHAVDIDPVSAPARNILARVSVYSRRFTAAAASARNALQLDSLLPAAPGQLAVAELFLGHRDSARAIALRLTDAPVIAVHRAFVLAATGDRTSNEQLLRTLESQRRTRVNGETSLAAAYLGLGDTAQALQALERAAKRRESFLAIEIGHPMFDPIRGSSRFTAILRAYGLDPVKVTRVASRRPE
jgi:serine/threonine-protein kinase